MNISTYNQSLNQAMPWTADLDIEEDTILLGEQGTASIPLEVKPSKESKIL